MHLTADICLGCRNNVVCFSYRIGLPYSSDGDDVPLKLGFPLAAVLPSWVPSIPYTTAGTGSRPRAAAATGWGQAELTHTFQPWVDLKIKLQFGEFNLARVELGCGLHPKKEQDLPSSFGEGKAGISPAVLILAGP